MSRKMATTHGTNSGLIVLCVGIGSMSVGGDWGGGGGDLGD